MCKYSGVILSFWRTIVYKVVVSFMLYCCGVCFFFQAEDGIRYLVRSRGLGDVYKRQILSPGSRLSSRMSDVRHIALSGEAYFEVERDTARPFVVETDDVRVTVLGTAFEVSSIDTSNSVLVRVRHGRVQVSTSEDTVILNGDEYARYTKLAHLLERMPAPHSQVWGDRIIQFKEAPLSEVVDQLEVLYHVRIRLANEGLIHCKLTATFDDEPIDYILRVIADTYGFTLTMGSPGSYTLDGDGC